MDIFWLPFCLMFLENLIYYWYFLCASWFSHVLCDNASPILSFFTFGTANGYRNQGCPDTWTAFAHLMLLSWSRRTVCCWLAPEQASGRYGVSCAKLPARSQRHSCIVHMFWTLPLIKNVAQLHGTLSWRQDQNGLHAGEISGCIVLHKGISHRLI